MKKFITTLDELKNSQPFTEGDDDTEVALLLFINSLEGGREFAELREELSNLTQPAKLQLLQLMIAVRIRAEAWGQSNPLPDLPALLNRG